SGADLPRLLRRQARARVAAGVRTRAALLLPHAPVRAAPHSADGEAIVGSAIDLRRVGGGRLHPLLPLPLVHEIQGRASQPLAELSLAGCVSRSCCSRSPAAQSRIRRRWSTPR